MTEKATIVRVGTIAEDGTPKDWVFDCRGEVAAVSIGDDWGALYGGYTIEELREIAEKQPFTAPPDKV